MLNNIKPASDAELAYAVNVIQDGFCLKHKETLAVVARLLRAEEMNKISRERLGPAGYRLLTELVITRRALEVLDFYYDEHVIDESEAPPGEDIATQVLKDYRAFKRSYNATDQGLKT